LLAGKLLHVAEHLWPSPWIAAYAFYKWSSLAGHLGCSSVFSVENR
jgi:hypothetical protein